MPIPEIASALSAAYNAAKMTGGLLKLSQEAHVQQVVIDLNNAILELQGKITGVQARYEELAEVKDRLEAKLREHERWQEMAARYQLTALAPNILVYALKAGQQGSEPAHYLCPHCFEEHSRSILHRPSAGHTNYVCHRCKFEARPEPPTMPSIQAVPLRRSSRRDGLLI